MGCCSKSRFPHSGAPSQGRGKLWGLEAGLRTSTLPSPNNLKQSHTWRDAGPGFHQSFPGFHVPQPCNQGGSTFLCLSCRVLSVFRFLLKEVRDVLVCTQTQSCRWPGLGTFPSPSGRAQSAGQVTEDKPSLAAPPPGSQRIPLTLWMLLCWGCPRWGFGGGGREAQGGSGDWPEAGYMACPGSVCAKKVATAQPVGNQETNCVGERARRKARITVWVAMKEKEMGKGRRTESGSFCT